ncbi:hypothetical protein HDV02_006143 [Globomyces sp. JEL0801]|nr:hypothetical protein HDV02_006143 [Globomyces sp. JEL0801]
MGGSFMTPILSQLNKIRDSVTSSPLNQMRVYDNLCTAMAINKIELRPLIDAMILPFRVDQFWDFFLSGIPENQLARPEDYNYKKVYIQMPIWISLFYTKFNVPPPPIGAENGNINFGARRDQMPVTPMGKRRFICGFMLTLLPCLGSYNPNLRYLSCITMIYCCFKGANGQGEMIRGLLEYSTQFLLVSKFISYQLSAIDIFAAVVRLKIPGIAESIFQEYFELCLEFLHNAHSPMIQISVLNLLEVFLLVFPKGMSTKLQEVRDIARVLMVDRDPNVVEAACKVYPLVFRAGSGIHGAEFEKFLIQELDLLEDITSPPALADPLINHLNEDQIQSLITDGTSSPFTTAQYLMRYLYHEKSIYRHNAFFSVMDNLETSTVIWVLMPLYADLNYDVRLAWSRFRRNAPSFLQLRCNSILPHPDDNAILPIISWEDILTDHTSLAINHKSLQDLASPIDALVPVQSFELPKEDEGFHLPTMSVKLLARFKELLQSMTTTLPPTSQNIVLYHLDQFKEFPPLQCPMMMVLSEFGCMHDDTFKSTGHILLSHLSLDPDFDNALLLEACILGIENLLRNSRPMIAEIVEQLTTRQVLSDGDLIAISYLHGILKDLISPNLVSETVEKLSAMTSSARFPHEKRLLASHLAGEFAIHGAPDDRKTLFEALQSFLESAPPNAIKEKIYMVAGRLIQEGEVHPLFKSMAVQSKKLLKSKDPKERIQSLSIFSIFGKSLPHDDKLGYLLRYLADSNEKIRDAARDVLISEDLVSNIRPDLLALPVETGRRAQLLQSGRLHTMDLVGIQINQGEQKETSQPESSTAYLPWVFGTSATEDPFNIRFFHSDLRQRYSKLYGVNELQYTRFMEPLTTGVIYEVNQRLNSCSPGNESHDHENELLKNVKPLSILEVLIKHSPSIAVNLIQNLLENIEAVAKINKTSSKGTFNEDEEDNSDVGIMTHIIDLMWNLMIAYGFKGDMVTNWLKRLREFLSVSSSTSEKLRETLYYDLEKSFYFQNQFIDIPIISDEQIAALQELRDLSQEAILDVVKSGKTEKVGLIDNKNDQWNGEVDSESDYLRRLTILSLQVLSGYGLYLSLTRDLPEDMLVDSFRFLMQFLDDEHRGFRIVLTESAVSIVSLLENFQQMPKLQDLVRDTVLTIHGRLLTESQYLYRKKADFASLISQLSVKLAPDDSVHANILSSLLELWKDPDSEVRNVSINMIQHLGEMRIPVVIKGFQDSTENSINLMKEIVILGNQEDYPEKDALQRLLKWRFSKDPNFWTLS